MPKLVMLGFILQALVNVMFALSIAIQRAEQRRINRAILKVFFLKDFPFTDLERLIDKD